VIADKGYEVGTVMKDVHRHIINNMTSDDPSVRKYCSTEVLNALAKSYVNDEYGNPSATPHALAVAQMYPGLFKVGERNRHGEYKPTVFDNIMHDAVEAHEKTKIFGRSAVLVPHFFPMDAIDALAAKEKTRHEALKDPIAADFNVASLSEKHRAIYEQHIDMETGQWKPESNGVILGELEIERMNQEGRRKYGQGWKDVGFGSNIFLDLKPTDAASSNPPAVIIGMIPGSHGMSINPEMMKRMGRDLDGDRLGWIPKTPDWGMHIDPETGQMMGSNFDVLHEKMTANNLAHDDSERIINSAEYGRLSQDQAVKMLKQYSGGETNIAAKMLGARTDTKGLSPLEGAEYWKKAADADSSQGTIVSRVAAYAHMMRKDKIKSQVPHPYMRISLGEDGGNAFTNSPKTEGNNVLVKFNPDLQDVQARLSFIKQYGAVDKFNTSGVNWDDAFNSAIITHVRRANGETLTLPDYRKQYFSEYQRAMTSLNKSMAENYTGSARNIDKSSKLERFATDDAFSKAAKDVFESFPHDEVLRKKADKHLLELQGKAKQGWTKDSFRSADDARKDIMLKEQCRALLNGFKIDNNNYARIATMDNGCYVDATNSGGKFQLELVRPDFKGSIKLGMDELFNPDGSFTPKMDRLVKGYDFPIESLFSDSDDGYHSVVDQSGKFRSFLVYNNYNEESKSADVGRAIAEYARTHADPDKAATGLLLDHMARVGNQQWYNVLSSVAENGVRPVVDASIERKYGRAWVLNPATGEFDSVQRLGKKWARIAGGDESLPGEVVSSEKKTSEDGSLVTELNTVKIRQPLENRFLEETAKNLGNKEEHGSFDFGVTLKQMPIPFFRPEMVQRVFKAVDKELGMDIVKAAEDPAEYQKYFDTLKKYVDTHMSEIPEADREEALQSLNPGGSFYANMAKQATNGNHSKEFWLMSQAFGTIQGLKRLAQSQPGWKDTTVGKFILSTNNYMERTADSLVMANAEDREFINQDDMLYTPGTYLNGVHTSSGDAVNMSTQVIRGSTFKGNQSVSSAWRRFLVPHKRVEDIKRISESRIDRFKPDTSAVDGMAQGGWLQNHLPDVKLSASYDDATHELHDGATVIVGGEAFPDIHVGLDKHYSSVIENPAERKAVVNGMAAIIETQLEGMRHANSVIARARITEQMMFDNADRVTDKRMVDMSAQMVSDLVEKAEHYSSMSPLQAYHALLGTDEGKAAHIFSSLLNYGDIGMFAPIYSSDPIVQAKPDEWQNMMLWDIGRKLFDWQGEYSQGASVNEKGGYVKRDKQLNGKLAFMRNMLERKKNEIEGGSDDVISINKGFESAQESFAKVVAEQEGLPDEKTIQAITSGQIIRAMHEIATEYGVGEQFAPLLETKATPDMFAKSMRSELRDHFGKHSALSLNMYNAKPDSNDLAHQNISWKLTNAYGLTKQFAHALDVDKTVQSMRANLDGRFVTDTPDIEVGKLCLVQHALADGTQKTIKGRYVGAFIPKSLHEVIGGDGKTGFATGKTSELFATFFDDVSGTKHIVNTNNIVSMIEDTTSGWRGSLDRRITKDKLRAPEFMKILSENSSLYHDMYGEQADFRVSKNGRNSLAELMQDKGVRNVGMMRDIEKFMFDSAKTAQIVGMYLGGKQMAGIGVGLGMMALGIPGGAPIATTAAISLGKKITVNLMSNLFTGTRNEYLFEGGKALNVLSPIYDRIHGVFRSTKDLVSTGQQTDGQVPLNVAAVQQKMAEGREATELQQEYGIEARPRDYKDELSALMLMKRYDQRFQALYDEEYSEQRTEMMQRIKQIKKNSDTYKDDLASIMKEFSWENYATKMLPKESAVLAMKGISVSESDGKVTFHGEAGIVDRAMDHYEKLSGVHKRIFDAYMSAASTGNPGMQAVGNILAHTDSFASRIANISKYAMKIPTMTEAVSASGADTSARRVVDGVEEMMVSRGFEPLNPTLKENLVASTATLSSGQYEGNQTTKNTLLGARAVCFQGFQQPMKTYTYGQHSDLASQYKFFRDAVKNDSAMRKYMTDVGIVTPEGVIWDKNRQLTRTMVTSFAFKAAGAAANALLTIALMKLYQASGDSEDEAVIKTKQNEVLKMQEKLQTYTDPLVRVLATDSDVPDALETMLGWIATKAPTHIMVETAQMRNKGKGKKLVAGTEAMIESDLKDDEWKMGTLSRLGGAPDVSNTLHLIGDGLMFAFLHNEAMRTRYADLISSSQASKVNARKVRQNTLDALEVQRDMQKWKIVERAADFVSPGLGGSISNAILHSEEMRAEARKEAKKN